ncbi:MAG: glycoside hydrolase family 3 N-terminal domain-containing protein [Bacteroidota bacterium]|nr:glycoside hydrolase family 3 N-terminal domain-containing protein [Bacteroidota bacterium]
MIRKSFLGLSLLLVSGLALNSVNASGKDKLSSDKKSRQVEMYDLKSHWVDSVFNALSPDERIAQMMMVAAYSNRDEKHVEEISSLIRKYNIGGLIFFQGGPIREAKQTNWYQSIAKTPLLIGIDGEWGLSMRLDSTMTFPRQMLLGAMSDDKLIYQMGVEISRQLKALGIHINFAPVVDVNNNPQNPVINNRSFGADKYLVARKGIAYMQGMQDNHIIATAKHFPGHGDTDTDSHLALPVIKQDYARLDSLELYPFRQLFENKVRGVMVGHLQVPAIDSTNIASSLSGKVISGLLKKDMNYTGLVFTDGLNMKGVSDFFKPGDLESRAVQAGNDVLLMPSDVPKAIETIKQAIQSGIIRQSQIDSSCRKILAAKEWAGLKKVTPIDLSTLREKLFAPSAQVLQRQIIESGLTLLQNKDDILPFKRIDTLHMAAVFVGIDKPNTFKETLSLYKQFDSYYLPKTADSAYVDSLVHTLRRYNMVVAGIHNTDYRFKNNFGIVPNAFYFLNRLVDSTAVVLDLFGMPYSLNKIAKLDKFKAVLVSYQDQPIIQDLSAQMMFGAVAAKGHLSLGVDKYPAFSGITTTSGLRLSYTLPEAVNVNSKQLAEIDSIVVDAIRKKAMPGCQVLVAKDGAVFYNKAFGYQTYEPVRPVKTTDIYDIASITKIAGTLPAVMKLYEEGKLNLNEKLSTYLPELKKSNKKNITLIDILTHQARLQSFIPFYLRTIEPAVAGEKVTSNKLSAKYSIKLSNNVYANNNLRYRKGLIIDHLDPKHGLQVANRMYLISSYADSIFNISLESQLLDAKKYEYSDMGFYYMYWLVERITQASLNEYDEENFYSKLGASTLGYLPLSRFDTSRIAPTENDQVFRKQVVRGYVHDPGAAMMGGVCGHAGVFSSANDLAKLMQMYLNKGTYGGEQYFKASTIDYFNSSPFLSAHNRRGIGFDKPEMNSANGPTCQCVSANSFGHSGFTGCLTWADPDSGLLYIFLSNRVYPDASSNKLAEMNVRTRIQEVLAKSIMK